MQARLQVGNLIGVKSVQPHGSLGPFTIPFTARYSTACRAGISWEYEDLGDKSGTDHNVICDKKQKISTKFPNKLQKGVDKTRLDCYTTECSGSGV